LRRRQKDELRKAIAREAAWLLYTGRAQEYKTAKEMAAEALGARIMPSNLEVALELDRIAEEVEGPERSWRLLEARREALNLMKALRPFWPKLVGSVWRGIAHKGSDIDIEVFWDEPEDVIKALEEAGYQIERKAVAVKQEGGRLVTCHHVYLHLPSTREAEIVIRPEADRHLARRCEIFGDVLRGLTLEELEDLLEKDPLRKFLPQGES